MPARHVVAFIVLFWAATTGWLYYRDLRPYLTPGNAPPFTISLFDEAEAFRYRENDTSKRKEGLEWSIYQDDEIKGYAVTWVKYRQEDDSFELKSQFKFWSKGRFSASDPDQTIENVYHVSRDGELRDVNASVTVEVPFLPKPLSGRLRGKVTGGMLALQAEAPGLSEPYQLPPVKVQSRGSVLNPMQPLNRLPGLRRGQHWRMPLVDPLDDVVRSIAAKFPALAAMQTHKVAYLDAEVLPQTIMLDRNDGKDPVECLVIEYHGEDISARTLVGAQDSLVYLQEVTNQGQNLRLVREDPGAQLEDKLNREYAKLNKHK
jgi:hypothetical protein